MRPARFSLICREGTYVADVEDVARGLVAAVEKGRSGEIYILGGYNYPFSETYVREQIAYLKKYGLL